jgi:hypothetical protein
MIPLIAIQLRTCYRLGRPRRLADEEPKDDLGIKRTQSLSIGRANLMAAIF